MKERSRLYLQGVFLALPVLALIISAWLVMGQDPTRQWFGTVIILIVVSVIGAYVYLNHRDMAFNHLLFAILVMSLSGMAAFALRSLGYLFMPTLLGVMLLAMVGNRQLALILHIGFTIIVVVVLGHGTVFMAYQLLMGIAVTQTIKFARSRNHIVPVLMGLTGAAMVLHTLLTLTVYDYFKWQELLLSGSNVGMSVIIGLGSLPIWETMFSVTTPLKLVELASDDQKLMQRLLMEAPGTYHHVKMVSNLAERGAKAVGCDSLLVRVGALYHDIGKLKEPGYFIENQNGGPNPHDHIAAEASAKIIMEHVTYGVKLGKEHRLPGTVIDIIEQHHGTSVIRYFYHKAKNYGDGVEVLEKDYSYKGPKPQTSEAAIVMLADCVEAFVRSLTEKDRHLDKIQWIIGEVIRQKLEDGQLDQCPLLVRQLNEISEAFMQVYQGVYHERIKYPEEERAQ